MSGSKPNDDEAARARDALFAGIAHDLRNPLNTFAMSTGLLKDDLESGDIDATRALSLVKRMERAAQRMQALIDDLVEASRLESRKGDLVKAPVDVAELVAEAVKVAEPVVVDRGASIGPGDVAPGLTVDVDRARMIQALAKAAAFVLRTTGERGRITIGGQKKADGGVELLVHGTNASDVPTSAPGRDEGRGGLALLIARGVVIAHGGSVAVSYGSGTTLGIVLP